MTLKREREREDKCIVKNFRGFLKLLKNGKK